MFGTQKGATLLEYSALVGTLVIIGGAGMISLGNSTSDTFLDVAHNLPHQLTGMSLLLGWMTTLSPIRAPNRIQKKESRTPVVIPVSMVRAGIRPSGIPLFPPGFVPPTLNLNSGFISYADPGEGDDLVDVNFADYMVQSEHWLANTLDEPVDLTIDGHPSARIIISGGPDVESGTILPRQSLIIRMQPPAAYSATREATVMAGDEPFAYFNISTRAAADLTPDPFDMDDVTEAEPGELVELPHKIITGIEVNLGPSAAGVGLYEVPVTVSGQGNPEVRVGGSGTWGEQRHFFTTLNLCMCVCEPQTPVE